MVNADLVISVAIWTAGIGMSAIGIEMTITPPTPEHPVRKWIYRGSFIVLGLVFISFSIWQSERLEQSQQREQDKHFQEQLRSDGNQKYLQGQLDSITKLLKGMSGNYDPRQVVAMLKNLATSPPPPTQSGARHLTPVQRSRLSETIAAMSGDIGVRVETVPNQDEPNRYAAEINDVVNGARHSNAPVIKGLAFEEVPEGVMINVHSELDIRVNDAAQNIARVMIATGIPVILNAHVSFPDKVVTILIGVQATD